MANSSRVHISKVLMDAFRQASLDNNPLHSNAGYAARTHFGTPSLQGRLVLTGGLGGMGGAQPLAVTMQGGICLAVEVAGKG